LNELLEEPYPWLKIVITCRPESWKLITRTTRLSEAAYYRSSRNNTFGMILDAFNYSEYVDEFSVQELPTVYKKYQMKYEIMTNFEELPLHIRYILRDPLQLWLVARTYKQTTIPSELKTADLIEKYISELIKSKRINKDDIIFLNSRIMPLMIDKTGYNNTLTGDMIVADTQFLNEIYSEQILRNGSISNQSFTNLLNAEILIFVDEDGQGIISFKYERFYEYFGGRRIIELNNNYFAKERIFIIIIKEIDRHPFLWGAAKSALISQTITNGNELLLYLCHTDHQRTKEVMVSTLIDLYPDAPYTVNETLQQLLPIQNTPGTIKRIRQVIKKSNNIFDSKKRTAGLIAVEVASTLCIPWPLENASMHDDSVIRMSAMRHIYHLWEHNPEVGFGILEQLAQSVFPNLIPNTRIFEVLFGTSMIIFFQHYRDDEYLIRLQKVWQLTLNRIFAINEKDGYIERSTKSFIRERLFKIAHKIIFLILEDLPLLPIKPHMLESFFIISDDNKKTYYRLISYMDPYIEYDKEIIHSDWLKTLDINDQFFDFALQMSFVAQYSRDFEGTFAFQKSFLELVWNGASPINSACYLLNSLPGVIDKGSVRSEIMDFFFYGLKKLREYEYSIGMTRTAGYLGPYIRLWHNRYQHINDPWLISEIENAFRNRSWAFFEQLTGTELPLLAIEFGDLLPALSTLELLFKYANKEEVIQEAVISLLAKLRLHYPDEIDYFLEGSQVPEYVRVQAKLREPNDSLGQLISIRVWWFLRDEVITSSPQLRTHLIEIMSNLVEHKELTTWIDYFIRKVVNLIYGKTILKER
jgi:hypothetical protein